MPIALLLPLITLGISLVKTGIVSYLEVKGILAKYADKEATPENVEAARLELLSLAKVTHAVDDPRIRAILEADGIDPESLRIG